VNKDSTNFHHDLAILFETHASKRKQANRTRRAIMVMTAQHTKSFDDIFTMDADPIAASEARFGLAEFGYDRLDAAKTPLDDEESDLEEDEDDEDLEDEDEDLEDDEDEEDDFEDDDDDLEDDEEEDDDDEDEEDDLEDDDDPKPLRVKTR
jgi:hypothetical protein